MLNLLSYFKTGFIIETEVELGTFVMFCINIAEKYLSFNVLKNKIYIPLDLNIKDAAIDLTSDLFTKENRRLVKFANFFREPEKLPGTETEAEEAIQGFLFGVVRNRLINLYRTSDPDTYRIMRNLNDEIHNLALYTSIFTSDKYIHRTEVNFEEKCFWESDDLIKFISNNIYSLKNLTFKEFIIKVFDLVESLDDFVKAVAYNDLVLLYKIFLINSSLKPNEYPEIETNAHYKILFDSIQVKFRKKLTYYFSKKNFSEDARNCVYSIVEDFTRNLLDGGIKKSPAELTKEFFPEKDYAKYVNRVEYCLQLLVSDMIKEISGVKSEV
jgi:hypothetical protein